MNFVDFEKEAKCYYCERGFHFVMASSLNQKHFICYCGTSKKFFCDKNFEFLLPLPGGLLIIINSSYKTCKITKSISNKIVTIYDGTDIPDLIFCDKIELIKRLNDLMIFI